MGKGMSQPVKPWKEDTPRVEGRAGTNEHSQPLGTQNFGGGPEDVGVLTGPMSKKSSPPPPDYYGAAKATSDSSQQAINQQTQQNRPDQYTNFGSNTWEIGPDGRPVQSTHLNKNLGGAASNLERRAYANSMEAPMTGDAARDQAITGAYGQATSRLDPQFKQAHEQLQSQLAAQGLDPTSEAAQTAEQNFGRQQNDAYNQAMYGAIGQGTSAGQAVFNQNMASQMAPYQQLGALQGFQNGLPGFNAAGAYQPTNYLGAAEDAGGYALQQHQQSGHDKQTGLGGVGQFASAVSDERIKADVKRLPVEAAPGIPMATFRFKHDPSKQHHLGVIAQDVERVAPQHVHTGPDGIKRVNYAALKPFGVK